MGYINIIFQVHKNTWVDDFLIERDKPCAVKYGTWTELINFSLFFYFYFLVTQANGNEAELMLMNVIIEQMICDTDPDLGRAVQLMGVIRVLIDPENMLPSLSKVEKTDFLNYFYKHSVHILIGID